MGFRRGGGGMGFGAPMPEHRVPRERRGETVRKTLAFFGPYRPRIGIVLLTILATSLLGLINPYLLKLLIDEALPERDFGKLNLFVAVMITVPIVSGLIGVGQSYLNNAIGQSVMEDLRNALYAHLQRMHLRFFAETRTGEIQSRLSNDVGGIHSVVTDTAASVVSNITVAISTIVAMVIIDWRSWRRASRRFWSRKRSIEACCWPNVFESRMPLTLSVSSVSALTSASVRWVWPDSSRRILPTR